MARYSLPFVFIKYFCFHKVAYFNLWTIQWSNVYITGVNLFYCRIWIQHILMVPMLLALKVGSPLCASLTAWIARNWPKSLETEDSATFLSLTQMFYMVSVTTWKSLKELRFFLPIMLFSSCRPCSTFEGQSWILKETDSGFKSSLNGQPSEVV